MKLRSRLTSAGFARREDGSLTILALFFFMVMVMIGGLSVDIMLFESDRTKLQNLTDRAALAAADLEQENDRKAVVESFFEKAQLGEYLDEVIIGTPTNATTVEVQTSRPMRTLFMNMVGIEEMRPSGSAVAEEGVSDTEISMILDVSGSMNEASSAAGVDTKLDDMKRAAQSFVDKVYHRSVPGRMTVSLVPYSTQVAIGPTMFAGMGKTPEHAYSHCLSFENNDFANLSLGSGSSYRQAGHFDPWSTGENPSSFVCRREKAVEVKPVDSDPETIKANIRALSAEGNTSIDLGLKWGAALLDPANSPVVARLARAGVVDDQHESRPFAYDRLRTRKFAVLLTDGMNTEEFTLNGPYRNGDSPVWRIMKSSGHDFYAVQIGEPGDQDGDGVTGEQYWIKGGTYGNHTWPDHFASQPLESGLAAAFGNKGQSKRLTFPELWAEMSVRHLAREYYADALKDRNAEWYILYELLGGTSGSTKDDRVRNICGQMRAKGVIVFTIGFEVNNTSAKLLSDCASTPNHFIRVAGDNLADAFESIASTITTLRLTQ